MKYNFKKILFLNFFVLGFFVVGVGEASAATYYVAPDGNDSRTTTQAQDLLTPWLTLQHAETAAANGDTVHVAEGTYIEDEVTSHSWVSSKAITWIADGNVLVKGTELATRALYLYGTTGTTSFIGFTFGDVADPKAYSVYTANPTSGKIFTNCTFTGSTTYAINLSASNSNITFSNPIVNISSGGVFQGGGINITWTGGTINAFGTRVWYIPPGSYGLTVSDVTVNATLTEYLAFIRGDLPVSFSGLTIDLGGMPINATLAGTSTVGSFSWIDNYLSLTAPTSGNIFDFRSGVFNVDMIRGAVTTAPAQTQTVIAMANQPNPLIDGLTIDTTASGSTSVYPIHIYSTGAVSVPIIRNCTIRQKSLTGYGIRVGSEVVDGGINKHDGVIITGNTLFGPLYYDPTATTATIHGIFIGHSVNADVSKNYINGEAYGLVLKGSGDSYVYTSGGVKYNNFVNCFNKHSVLLKGVKNVSVSNNTAWMDSFVAENSNQMFLAGDTVVSKGAMFKNNIFVGKPILVGMDTSSDIGLISDYNLLYRYNGEDIAKIDSATYSWTNWQDMGFDIYSVSADPRLVSYSNLSLQNTSPAIDAGTSVGLTTDYAGNPIYGTPDIGAYEYQPPHTMGSDKIDIGAGARIYGDGKFRDKEATSSDLADLTITPESGSFETYKDDEVRPEWMDIKNITWEANTKKWTEISNDSSLTNTLHTVGDLAPNTSYTFKIDNTLASDNIESTDCQNGICTADQNGKLAFVYTGTYSEHTFELTANQELPENEDTNNDNQETESTKISNIKSDNLILDENKKIYLEEDRTKLKGEDQSIANGKVKIYKNSKLYKEITVDENGKWSKKISFDHDRNYTIKLEFFDKFSTLRDEKEYEIKVDTEKPVFQNKEESSSVTKDEIISFPAEDEETKIDYYKIKVLDKNGQIIRKWKKQKEDFYEIPEKIKDEAKTVIVRAYDKAGNKSELRFNIEPRKALPRGGAPAQLPVTGSAEEVQEVIEVETEVMDEKEELQESSPEPITGNNSSETKTEIQPTASEKPVTNLSAEDSKWWNPFSWF